MSGPSVGQACPDDFCVEGYCDFMMFIPVCKAKLADGANCTPTLMGMDCLSRGCNASSKCEASRCAMP